MVDPRGGKRLEIWRLARDRHASATAFHGGWGEDDDDVDGSVYVDVAVGNNVVVVGGVDAAPVKLVVGVGV